MQDQLLDALGAADPEQELISRLAAILRCCSVLLYNELGDVVASSGKAPSHLMRVPTTWTQRLIYGSASVSGRLQPTRLSPEENHWLVVASTRHQVPRRSGPIDSPGLRPPAFNAIERSRYRAALENCARQAAHSVRELVAGEIIDQFSAEVDILSRSGSGTGPQLRVFAMSPPRWLRRRTLGSTRADRA